MKRIDRELLLNGLPGLLSKYCDRGMWPLFDIEYDQSFSDRHTIRSQFSNESGTMYREAIRNFSAQSNLIKIMQSRLKLIRYFSITSWVAFGCVAAALIHFHASESKLVKSVQNQNAQTFHEMQTLLVNRAEEVARRDLLTTHEDSNVQLARLLSNGLWKDPLAPFLVAARAIDFTHCLNLSKHEGTVAVPMPSAQTRATCAASPSWIVRAPRLST